MNKKQLRANIFLLITAIIWGIALVAMRAGMEHISPFAFNGIRFTLGACSLIPLIYWRNRQQKQQKTGIIPFRHKTIWLGSISAGLFLFMAASFQQAGMVYTPAGKAGFITGLYVIIVPILGLLWGQRTNNCTWIGAIIATIGLYFLSISENLTIEYGDLLILCSTFFWALHIQLLGWLAPKTDTIKLACGQFFVCAGLSLFTAIFIETNTVEGVVAAAIPLIYTGLLSVGIAYTLQVIAQKDADPASTSIILSLQSLFAAVGGWLLLSEILSTRNLFGCVLMLTGMLLSQIPPKEKT